ncbi:glycoside hydrolase family 17 protein [Conidiobolus coronatus NRRL 28638]|uniref:glucan endo-1,3-beta-D-glucosidase n=1 Tax=Conidiobolus coronatus (strain ATCC 28846 / CBS 209.66 / NRRL 28638) TaxID=796925 RepID=A0A137NW34_CONC2|nr:glycoside hydrolase family 17 protein [Conidiobolus coronatus NRRL 28638]|eukprot:KXN66982.1 glycoside hydrolase family 17 protein [Conidiobolus coronatus NRRL 28638]
MQLIIALSALIAGVVSIPQAQGYQTKQARPFPAITYSPYNPGSCASADQVASDIKNIAQYAEEVRLYAADCDQVDNVLKAIVSQGLDLKVMLGVWTRGGADRFQTEISSVSKALSNPQYRPHITKVTVGNEELSNGGNIGTLSSNLQTVQDALNQYNVPTGVVEVGEKIMENASAPAMVNSKFLGCNIQPYFNGFLSAPVSSQQAIPPVNDYMGKIASYFPNKELVITEIGFPSSGTPSKDYGTCSPQTQFDFLKAARCQIKNWKFVAFEAYDATFKNDRSYGGVENNFGIINRDGSLKAGSAQSYFQC